MAAPARALLRDLWIWILAATTVALVFAGTVGRGVLVRQTDPSNTAPPSLASEGQRAWSGILASLPASLPGARGCRFILGFRKLESLLGRAVVGQCLEDERFDPAWGVAVQITTNGLLVFRRADGMLAFTDGYRTWLLGPAGLQRRLNTERMCWEPDADPRNCLSR